MSISTILKLLLLKSQQHQLRKKPSGSFTAIKYPNNNVGINVLNSTIKTIFLLVNLVKTTLFEQFCGGETHEQSMNCGRQNV